MFIVFGVLFWIRIVGRDFVRCFSLGWVIVFLDNYLDKLIFFGIGLEIEIEMY